MAKTARKPVANQGYIYPMTCDTCLKIWLDNRMKDPEEEWVVIFSRSVAVRTCPRCIAEGAKNG